MKQWQTMVWQWVKGLVAQKVSVPMVAATLTTKLETEVAALRKAAALIDQEAASHLNGLTAAIAALGGELVKAEELRKQVQKWV